MKIRYFEETDTAMVEIGQAEVAETRELSEDVYLDLDAGGRVVAITIEHASQHGNLSEIVFQRVTASQLAAQSEPAA